MDLILWGLGIIVAVGLFLLGLPRIEGARKARVAAANVDLERILMRRIVVDKYTPNEGDIARLAEAKAREHRVRLADLSSTTQLLNTVYMRIVESDLIPSDQREEIVGRIVPVLTSVEAEPLLEESVEDITVSHRRVGERLAFVAATAVSTSVFGGVVAVVVGLSAADTEPALDAFPANLLIATIAASLTLITTIAAATRWRSSQEKTGRTRDLSRYVAFENRVRTTLERFGTVRHSVSDQIDFLVRYKDCLLAIDVKAWSVPIPRSIMLSTAKRVKAAADKAGATQGIVVTLGGMRGLRQIAEEEGVKAFTLKELRAYLAELSK